MVKICLFYVSGNYNKIQYNTTARQYNNEDSLNSTVICINYEEFCYASQDPVENRPHFRPKCCHQRTMQDMRFLFVVPRCPYLTFRHRASSIYDRHFATLQRTLFIYLINKYISLSDMCFTVHH